MPEYRRKLSWAYRIGAAGMALLGLAPLLAEVGARTHGGSLFTDIPIEGFVAIVAMGAFGSFMAYIAIVGRRSFPIDRRSDAQADRAI